MKYILLILLGIPAILLVVFIFIGIPFYLLNLILEKVFPNKNNTKLKNIILCCVFLLIMTPWLRDCMQATVESPRLAFRIANYQYTHRILCVIDFVRLGNIKIADSLRHNVFNQYMKIKNSFKDNEYEAIGLFSHINDEYINIQNKCNIDAKYKQLYLDELKRNLDSYIIRNSNLDMDRLDWRYFAYNIPFIKDYYIPNRINFYPRLALSYLYQADIQNSKETIYELSNILLNFDIVLNQEKENNTRDYRTKQTEYNYIIQKKLLRHLRDYTYPVFINQYPQAIIKMAKDLEDENLCSMTIIFDYYFESLKYGYNENPEIMHIIKDQCNYD
ncbi:hypothetical protein IKQ26_05795 [bacterium]|nr:hypothetical protein [bacterium]